MRHVPLAALLAAALFLIGSSSAQALVLFHTPSNNIGCAMSDNGTLGVFVRCDIAEIEWTMPPEPKTMACRELDYVQGLTMGAKGKPKFFCAGDTVLRQGRVLRYGHSRRAGRFTCTSRTSGLTCRNRHNGHGLFLSRASYRRF